MQAATSACQAAKYSSAPECLVIRSFREGLCSETSNRCRRFAERKCSKTVLYAQDGFSFLITARSGQFKRERILMDKLMERATVYQQNRVTGETAVQYGRLAPLSGPSQKEAAAPAETSVSLQSGGHA